MSLALLQLLREHRVPVRWGIERHENFQAFAQIAARHLARTGIHIDVAARAVQIQSQRVLERLPPVIAEELGFVAATFADIKQRFGKVDILVNNAGIYNLLPIDQITPEDFHRQAL
jgi:NAD(P)-dependent dehydrogenase (short-subunit alcohol dehydrogenase family)